MYINYQTFWRGKTVAGRGKSEGAPTCMKPCLIVPHIALSPVAGQKRIFGVANQVSAR